MPQSLREYVENSAKLQKQVRLFLLIKFILYLVTIEATKEYIKFSVTGEIGAGSITVK